jgi:hypothetical protein
MLVNIFEQIISVDTVFVWTSQQIVSVSGVLKGLSTRQNTKFKYNTCFKSISLHFNTIVKILNPIHENTPPCWLCDIFQNWQPAIHESL